MRKVAAKVDTAVLPELYALGADRDVVRFVLAYDGVLFVKSVTPERDSRASMKQLKRRVQRLAGSLWREIWPGVKRVRKDLRQVQLEETLFTLEPLPPRPTGRPRELARWLAYFDLRTYLAQITGSPHPGLIGRLLFPRLKPESVTEEWSRRSPWFAGIDTQVRLNGLLQFYEAHRTLIRRALVTGKPLREWFDQGAGRTAAPPWAPSKDLQIDSYVGQCPYCGASYKFLKFPSIPDPRHHSEAVSGTRWSTAVCECGSWFSWKV